MSVTPINKKSLLQYSFIALPVAFAGFPLYVLAPDLYATRYGLSLTLLGVLLLIIRLFDAIQDPLIGWLTDKLHGRFLTLLIAASTVLCLSIFGLFNSLFFTPAVWFTLCMAFAVSAYSILTIILGAQATLWTTNPQDQTTIASAREAFGLIGLVIAVSMPAIISHLTDNQNIYLWYSIILVILMTIGLVGFSKIISNKNRKSNINQPSNKSLLSALKALPRKSIQLLLVYSLSMLASSIPAVLVIFYVRDLIGAAHLVGLFLFTYFISGVLAMPLWHYISIRVGKYKTWFFSNILAVVGFSGAFFLNTGDILPYAIICVISGFALSADLTMPPSILADNIHDKGNSHFSGSHYAFLALITKASLALASAIALPLLDYVGFKPQAANSEKALMLLSMTYGLIPCMIKLLAASLLYNFFVKSQSGVKK